MISMNGFQKNGLKILLRNVGISLFNIVWYLALLIFVVIIGIIGTIIWIFSAEWGYVKENIAKLWKGLFYLLKGGEQ